MKGLFRSGFGKGFLFFFTVLWLVVSVSLGAVVVQSEIDGFYDVSTENIEKDIKDICVYYIANKLIISYCYGEERPAYGNIIYTFYSENQVPKEVIDGTAYIEGMDAYHFYFNPIYFNSRTEYYPIDFLEYTGSGSETSGSVILELFIAKDAYPEFVNVFHELAYKYSYLILGIFIGSVVLFIINLIALISVSGKRKGTEEIFPGFLSKLPADIMLAFYIVCGVLLAVGFCDMAYANVSVFFEMYMYFLMAIGAALLLTTFVMDFAARIKAKTIFKNTVIYKLGRVLGKAIVKCGKKIWACIKTIPGMWASWIGCAVFFLLALIAMASSDRDFMQVFIFFFSLCVIVAYLLSKWKFKKIKNAASECASGNFNIQLDTKELLFPEYKELGNSINAMGNSMTKAVNEGMKSERMKTELITNVSHDLKTPLTSIINYADLLENEAKEEAPDKDKVAEYSQVISRQSGKLKHLLENLVEVSKANSGAISTDMVRCEAGILLGQAAGEFEEKLKNAGLTTIVNIPEEPISILADRQLLWRVFDNLLGNICKYSLSGSRVYLSLARENDSAVIRFKNTSKDELNVSPSELAERFVRGDASRTTEGNGLGLAIAKSLTELMGGKFYLHTDADLFTAVLDFKIVK